jgi:hypothetical protein
MLLLDTFESMHEDRSSATFPKSEALALRANPVDS